MADLWTIFMKKLRKMEIDLLLWELELWLAHQIKAWNICFLSVQPPFWQNSRWPTYGWFSRKKLRKNEVALLLLELELRSAHLVRAYELCFLFVQPPFWKIPRWPTYGWFLWKKNLLCSCHFENKIRNGLPMVIFAILNRESTVAVFFLLYLVFA